MPFSDEIVMAYVDGELGDATRAALELAMTTDPDLAQRVARHRELRRRVQGAFDPVLAEPVPERLLAAANGAAVNARDDNIIALKRLPARRWTWPQWGAIAASLVVGVLIAQLLPHEPDRGTARCAEWKGPCLRSLGESTLGAARQQPSCGCSGTHWRQLSIA